MKTSSQCDEMLLPRARNITVKQVNILNFEAVHLSNMISCVFIILCIIMQLIGRWFLIESTMNTTDDRVKMITHMDVEQMDDGYIRIVSRGYQ